MLNEETNLPSRRLDARSAAFFDRRRALWHRPPERRFSLRRRSVPVFLSIFIVSFCRYTDGAGQTDQQPPPVPLLQFGTNAFHHPGGFSQCVFSPDGKKVFTLGKGGVIAWDVESGREDSRVEADPGGSGFAISSDGRLLAFQRPSLFIDVFDSQTGKVVKSLFTHASASVSGVAFVADDQVLLVATESVLYGFELSTGRTLWEAPYQGTFAMQRGLKTLAKTDGTKVVLLDALTGRQTNVFTPVPNAQAIVSLAFSHDGSNLAIGWQESVAERPVRLGRRLSDEAPCFASKYRFDTARIEFETAIAEALPYRLAMSADCRWLVVRDGKSLWAYDTADPETRVQLSHYGGGSPSFSPDGKLLIAAGGSRIAFWNVGDWQRRYPGHIAPVRYLAVSEEDEVLATCSSVGTICTWNLSTGECTGMLHAGAYTTFMQILPDDELITAHDGRLILWDLKARQVRKTLTTPFRYANHWILSPHGKLLAAFNYDTIWIWEMPGGRLIHRHSARNPTAKRGWFRIETPTFSPHGMLLAFEEVDRISGRLIVLDVSTGKAAMKLEGQPKILTSLKFSPDGGLLLAAGRTNGERDSDDPGIVMIWELATRQPVVRLEHPDRSVGPVRFFNGGQSLLTFGSNRGYKYSIRILGLPEGAELAAPQFHRNTGSVRLLADGSYVLADGPTAQLWRAPSVDSGASPQQALPSDSFSARWVDLAAAPDAAFNATLSLARRGDDAVKFLGSRKDQFVRADEVKIKRLLSMLRSIRSTSRESARLELCELGPSALMILEKAYEDTDAEEVRRPLDEAIRAIRSSVVQDKEELRRLRAVRALRMIGTPDAVALADSL